MEHTPGPWSFEDSPTLYDYIRLWGMGGHLHMGYLNKQPGQEARIRADAQLISAVPDMLAFVDAYDAWAQDDDDESKPFSGPKFHAMVAARAVLEDKYGI